MGSHPPPGFHQLVCHGCALRRSLEVRLCDKRSMREGQLGDWHLIVTRSSSGAGLLFLRGMCADQWQTSNVLQAPSAACTRSATSRVRSVHDTPDGWWRKKLDVAGAS